MKEASLYIRIVECFLLLMIVLWVLYYFFLENEKRDEDYVESLENETKDSVNLARAELQQYYDYAKLLDPVSKNLNPYGVQQRYAQDVYRASTLDEINKYCNTSDPENILSKRIFQSKDFSVCKTPPKKDEYKPTIVAEGFVDPNRSKIVSSGYVTIPRGVKSFDYTVIGGGGAGGGGGARFSNKEIGNRGGGGGGGGSSGGIVKGSVTIEPNMTIYAEIGKGGKPIRGSRYTHNTFTQRGLRNSDNDFKFTDASVAVSNPPSTKQLPWRGQNSSLNISGKTAIRAPGGNGGFAGGNVGMEKNNRKIIIRRNKGEYHYFYKNWGFGSDGGEAVTNGKAGQKGNHGDENLGQGNTGKGGEGGKLGQINGYGDGGNGGNGASNFYRNVDDGNYGSAGNNGAVIIEWK